MLIILEQVRDYFTQVSKWANTNHLTGEFNKALTYLHLYGCTWDNSGQTRVTLYSDFAPQSFGVEIERLDNTTGEYRHWMNGGLIYHASDKTWSMHT